jgi:hypothetical protein
MVKKSPEDLAGRMYRSALNPAKPPPDLGQPERILWKSIVDSLPPDWFTPGSLPLLQRYVRSCILAERLHDQLDLLPARSPEAADFVKRVIAINGSCGSLAARLRLSTQVTMTARSTGKMAERRSSFDDELIPGFGGRNGGAGFRQ